MRKIKNIYPILFATALLMACTPDKPNDNFGNETGIKGKVKVQNEFQQPLYEERGGINVLLHVGFQDFNVTADNVGEWMLTGAPVGNYTITYSKEGYSTVKVRSIHISNTVPDYPIDNGYQKLPTATITQLPLTDFQNFTLDLSFTVQGEDTLYSLEAMATMLPAPPPTGQPKGYRIFIGTDETVSPDNYIFQEYHSTTSAAIDDTYDNDWFVANGISSGDALYAVLYGDVSFNQEIENADSTLTFPNLAQTPGELASVVLP